MQQFVFYGLLSFLKTVLLKFLFYKITSISAFCISSVIERSVIGKKLENMEINVLLI